MAPMIRATYRVQLHATFGFDDAAAIVPYLAELGISHLHASPILQAAVDHDGERLELPSDTVAIVVAGPS